MRIIQGCTPLVGPTCNSKIATKSKFQFYGNFQVKSGSKCEELRATRVLFLKRFAHQVIQRGNQLEKSHKTLLNLPKTHLIFKSTQRTFPYYNTLDPRPLGVPCPPSPWMSIIGAAHSHLSSTVHLSYLPSISPNGSYLGPTTHLRCTCRRHTTI